MRWLPLAPPSLASGAARSTDWLWGGLGITIAGASASFAGYMIVTAPSTSGSKDFSIFAQFDHRTSQPAEAAAHPGEQPASVTQAAATPAGSGVDREPTGSIPQTTAQAAAPATSRVARSAAQDKLRDFVVRDVFGNKALIEHGKKLSLVKQGSILDDAGEVLAIERHGGSWVVRTASGIIGGL